MKRQVQRVTTKSLSLSIVTLLLLVLLSKVDNIKLNDAKFMSIDLNDFYQFIRAILFPNVGANKFGDLLLSAAGFNPALSVTAKFVRQS